MIKFLKENKVVQYILIIYASLGLIPMLWFWDYNNYLFIKIYISDILIMFAINHIYEIDKSYTTNDK